MALSVLRGAVTETGANTLTETTINTPTDNINRFGMILRRVMFTLTPPDTEILADDTLEEHSVTVALSTRNGLLAMPNFNDPGMIARPSWIRSMGKHAAGEGPFQSESHQGFDQSFPEPGLVVADSQLSLYILGGGNAAVQAATVVIFYELKKLTLEEFVGALSLLENF